MKIIREIKDYAKDLGLKFVGIEGGSKHMRVMFHNSAGYEYGVTVHRTKNEVPWFKMLTTRRQLDAFSEGKYDKLPVRKLS